MMTEQDKERQKYVKAFNTTMLKIWQEQITRLGVIRTGALFRSVVNVSMSVDGQYLSPSYAWAFRKYGIYVDYGTGSNTPRGNPGDIGKANNRKKKKWFSRKFFASAKNIQEFFAENLGKECCHLFSNALDERKRLTF